ncbi:MAG TPA: transferase [Polyangia bacterium]|nr:transferase [Polyangia bacterium]
MTVARPNPSPLPDAPLPTGEINANPSDVGFFELLAEDFQTYDRDPMAAGFWAVAVHRVGNWRMSIKSRWLRAPATVAYRMAYRGVIALWGIDLPYNMKIGRRFRLGHHGCVHIGAREIGDDVTVYHSVTVGLIRHKTLRFPMIGDRVEIGPGAAVVGSVNIGDDTIIGANTVVGRDLPASSKVMGIPMRFEKP